MKENLKLGGTLLIITAIAGLILAFAYDITRGPIETRAKEEKAAALKVVLEADEFNDYKADTNDAVTNVVEATTGGKVAGYVFTVNTKGYGGNIEMLVGIKADSTVSGIQILKQSETPGLGSKAQEDPSFAEQFKGKPAQGKLAVGTDIDAIGGATITSNGVTAGVNTAIEFYSANILGIAAEEEAPLDENAEVLKEILPTAGSFTVLTTKLTDNVLNVFEADNGGFVINVTAEGFDGTIDMLVGIDADGKVSGMQVLSHTETEGLGSKAKDDKAWGEQFIGKATDGKLEVGADIEAISGATITSKAVTSGVNTAIEFYNTNLKGAK